jgi:hypothetical protein
MKSYNGQTGVAVDPLESCRGPTGESASKLLGKGKGAGQGQDRCKVGKGQRQGREGTGQAKVGDEEKRQSTQDRTGT